MNAPDRLPYPGLRPFHRDEADLFFGRESSVNDMVARLAETRFLAVLGPSGSGKSSLVRTGLLDALELGLMAGAGPRWLIADLHPGARPMESLAQALLGLAEPTGRPVPAETDPVGFARMLRRGPRSLIEWWQAGHVSERTNLLVLVDQFEELFRYANLAGRDEAEAFAALLIQSAAAEELPIYVVLTMRSEFLGPCALIPDLAERINAGLYLTRRMTREEIREAIEGPAAVCGFAIEPVLVNTLLNDLASFAPWEGERGADQFQMLARRADQLPLLQHVLNRLWLAARRTEDEARITLRLEAYEALGGLAGALDKHAEEVLAAIGAEHRPFAEPIFRALVDGTSIATAVRRPCRIDELVTLANGNRGAVEEVVEAFRAPSCNFLVASPAGPLGPETAIDISHESLIRQWQRLSEWLAAEAKAADEYRYLEETASRWQRGHAGLLRMPTLAASLAWRARECPTVAWAKRYGGDFPLAMRFLEQSGRRRETLRRSYIGAGVLAALLILGGVPTLVHQRMVLNRVRQAQQAALTRLRDATTDDNIGVSYLTGQGLVNGHGMVSGQGVERNYAAAKTWFEKAVALGSIDAAYRMGTLFEHGNGVPQDYKKAAEWYRKAAEKGYAAAEFALGYLYEGGLGTAMDAKAAIAWYQKAAAQGDAWANNNLGYLYQHASPPDYAAAMLWYERAAAVGDATAEDNIGFLFEHHLGVKQDYAAAMTHYKAAALAGDSDGAFKAGYFFEQGYGVQQNYSAAMKWYTEAAAAGSTAAENNIGYLYQHGLSVKQDYAEAMTWYEKAAAGGNPTAASNIGDFYQDGLGVKQDYAAALRWYRKAASEGNPEGVFEVGYFYDHGLGVKQNYAAALIWYRKAASQGNATAENNIGFFYQHGLGVKQDYAVALVWYRKAAAAGSMPVTEIHIGEILTAEARFDEALASCRQAVQLAKAALATNPKDQGALRAITLAAEAIGNISYHLLLHGEFAKALDAADSAVGFGPDLVWLQTNRADALMMLGETDAARRIYLRYKEVANVGTSGGASWKEGVLEDFAALRKRGFSSPLMAEIEADFRN